MAEPDFKGGVPAEVPSLERSSSAGSLSSDKEFPHYQAQRANTKLEHMCLLDIFTTAQTTRNTGIVCTIGERGRDFHHTLALLGQQEQTEFVCKRRLRLRAILVLAQALPARM